MGRIHEIKDEMENRRILGFLGIAKRARKLVYGKDGIKSYLRKKNGRKLVIVTEDIGDRIFNDILRKSKNEDTIILILKKIGKIELGHSIGKVAVSAVALNSPDMVDGILRSLNLLDF